MLQNNSIELCLSCLNTYNPVIQQRGMSLIYKIYSVSKLHIKDGYDENIEFHLLSEVGEDLIEVLNGIYNRHIERSEFDLNYFFTIFLFFCIKMKKLDNRTSEYDHEINILKKLASCIGGYIHVQRLNHHIIDEHYWINFFSDGEDFKTAELDESKQELFSRYFLEIYYNYFQGLIMNAEENIIAIGIFQKYLNSIIKLQN